MEAIELQASAPVLWLVFANKLQPDDHKCRNELPACDEVVKMDLVLLARQLLLLPWRLVGCTFPRQNVRSLLARAPASSSL